MHLPALLTLALPSLTLAIPTLPLDRRAGERIGLLFNTDDKHVTASLYANTGCFSVADSTRMRLAKGYRCKFYYGKCENIMGNEDGKEGEGMPGTGGNPPSILSILLAPMQNLEGTAKGAACWKVE